jgi:hypothetical protein
LSLNIYFRKLVGPLLLYLLITYYHRWASTSISMSAISDIQHRHLLFQYRRQICRTEKRHSDIGSVPKSTSEFIPISDIEEKKILSCRFERAPLGMLSERFNTKLLQLYFQMGILDKTLFRYPI